MLIPLLLLLFIKIIYIYIPPATAEQCFFLYIYARPFRADGMLVNSPHHSPLHVLKNLSLTFRKTRFPGQLYNTPPYSPRICCILNCKKVWGVAEVMVMVRMTPTCITLSRKMVYNINNHSPEKVCENDNHYPRRACPLFYFMHSHGRQQRHPEPPFPDDDPFQGRCNDLPRGRDH